MDKVDIFLPLPLGADAVQRRGDENYNIIVRLKPGVSVQQAQADIDVIASGIRIKDKRDPSFGMDVVGLQKQVVGDVRRCPARAARLGRARAADRLRQRGQSSAVARHRPREGSRHPHRAGRGLAAPRAPTADRKHSPRPTRRRRRAPRRAPQPSRRAHHESRQHSAARRDRHQRHRSGLHLRPFARHRRTLRPRAGVARHQARSQLVAQSRRPQRARPMAVST